MLEEEVEALQVGFEKGVWAKPIFGMEIFDEGSPFCEEYFFQTGSIRLSLFLFFQVLCGGFLKHLLISVLTLFLRRNVGDGV